MLPRIVLAVNCCVSVLAFCLSLRRGLIIRPIMEARWYLLCGPLVATAPLPWRCPRRCGDRSSPELLRRSSDRRKYSRRISHGSCSADRLRAQAGGALVPSPQVALSGTAPGRITDRARAPLDQARVQAPFNRAQGVVPMAHARPCDAQQRRWPCAEDMTVFLHALQGHQRFRQRGSALFCLQ